MARASLLAYQPPANLKQIATTAWNLASENVQVFGAGNEQAFGFATPDFVVIAFRGTVPKILDTVLADARICLKPPSFGPLPQADPRRPLQVHCGFLAAMDGLLAATPSNPIDFLALEANKNKKIFVTGHSLGAAMATLFAAKLLAEGSTRFCGLCTFGSPRVGTTAFTQWLDGLLSGRSFRFVDDQDVVTRVAPRELGYDHVDAVYFLNANGQMETTGAGWTQFLNTVIDAVTDFKNLAALSVDDHSMDLYVRKIENLASA
jgi:pimeloyl-ACP methyl ester carboxylesterase